LCIFVATAIGLVLTTIVANFVYGRWQNVLTLKQDLHNLQHTLLDVEENILELEDQITNIRIGIDNNNRLLLSLQDENQIRRLERDNLTDEININNLEIRINRHNHEINDINREILDIEFIIDDFWLM
jgi:predicted  nucleic acid-binding Zn-ribbon protein